MTLLLDESELMYATKNSYALEIYPLSQLSEEILQAAICTFVRLL